MYYAECFRDTYEYWVYTQSLTVMVENANRKQRVSLPYDYTPCNRVNEFIYKALCEQKIEPSTNILCRWCTCVHYYCRICFCAPYLYTRVYV